MTPVAAGDGPDVVLDRVAFDDAPAGVRVADPGGVMQRERRLEPGQAGCHELRSAREAGEEMGLDKAGRDADVGRQPLGVEPDRDVMAEASHPGERGGVTGVVVDDAHGPDEIVAEHLRQFVVGVGAMGAGGNQYDHVFKADDPFEFVKQGRDDGAPRLGARPVADGDSDGLAGPDPMAKGQPAYRLAERRMTAARPSGAGGG